MEPKVEVIQWEGRKFDSGAGPVLRAKAAKAWASGATVVVLDLSEVVYIDSLGIAVLISEQRKRPDGSRIVLTSLCDYVRDILEVTQLVRVFDIYASADAARTALSGVRS